MPDGLLRVSAALPRRGAVAAGRTDAILACRTEATTLLVVLRCRLLLRRFKACFVPRTHDHP